MLDRLIAVQNRIQEFKLDAIVLSCLSHIRYLFGFTGSNALVLITPDGCFFITDRRYVEQSRQQVKNAEIVIARHDLFSELPAIQAIGFGKKIGLEVAHLTARDFLKLKKISPDTRFIASERIVERICSIKYPVEIENIRRAADICAQVFAEIRPLLRVGVQELEIAAEISYLTKRHGSEGDPFEPIVASGERSALPHGRPTRKKLGDGELIIIDFGATSNGYAADCSRTFLIGQANKQQQELIQAVSAALTASETAARPGMTGKILDAVARDYLKMAGYANYFQHSLGHGLGIDVHELPRIGENSDDVLCKGQVITMEPGLYVPGVGGVRIEDDYLLTEDGVENLSPFAREVLCV